MRMASIDTGAIEGLYAVERGFTMTVASMAAAWQAEIQQEKGPEVAALVAAQYAGYDLALDAASSKIEISEAWIRRMHEVVCGPQETFDVRTEAGPQRQRFPRGEYKQAPNHVLLTDGSTHAYAPVDDTPIEMYRLVSELRSPAFAMAHPVLQASYAHYALACVHPFADGNGRVARTLASVFTFRAVSLPFVLFVDQKNAYLRALEESDQSRFQPFVDFVQFRAVDLQQLVTEQLREALGTPVEEAARRLGDLALHPEVRLIREHIGVAAERQFTALHLPDSVVWDVAFSDRTDEYGPQNDLGIRIFIRMFSPLTHSVEDFLSVAPRPEVVGQAPAFVVRRLRWPEDTLQIRRDEASPAISAALDARITAWVRRVTSELLRELSDAAERA